MTNRLLVTAALGIVLAASAQSDEGSTEVQDLIAQAEKGNAVAQYELAMAYEHGVGVETSATKALEYYRLAANQGHAAAQNEVGNSFHGQGRFVEALPWYEKSSEGGDFWGIHNLAYLYDQGRGVVTNEEKAISLYQRAANLDNADSMWNMAMLYANGRQIPTDLHAACVWTHRAVTSFDNKKELDSREKRVRRHAKDSILLLQYETTEDQMTTCKNEAAAWPSSPLRSAE